MIFHESAPFVKAFVESLSNQMTEINKTFTLSRTQKFWIGFCIMGIYMTGTLCWSHFEKYGLQKYKVAALSWMLRHSKLMWEFLLIASVRVILEKYNIKNGHLVIDDSDLQRSKSTKKIAFVHKIHDKKTGGYFMGQNIVFLLLVTDKITIPVGFKFFMPDPVQIAWTKHDEKLRKQKIAKSERPKKPKNDPNFPTKIQIALNLIQQFALQFPSIKIHSVSADALYGSKDFFKLSKKIYPLTQIISQLRKNQKVIIKNKSMSLEDAFLHKKQHKVVVQIRGGESKNVIIATAKMHVERHKKLRTIIALKYEEDADFRYIIASDYTWRETDIVKAYSLRWLVEVYISDWKRYEGFGQMAFQHGVDGTCSGVILSLLSDLCLLSYPDQIARVSNNTPACTVGSRRDQIRSDALLGCFSAVISDPKPWEAFEKIKDVFSEVFKPRDSKKHLVGKNINDLRPKYYVKKREMEFSMVI